MKTTFIIFLSIVILIYGLANYYVYYRGNQAIQYFPAAKTIYTILFWSFASCYLLARIVERVYLCVFSDLLIWIGSFWLAFILYAFFLVVLIDIFRLTNSLFHWFPSFIITNATKSAFYMGIFSFLLILALLIGGHINALIPKITKLDINIHKTTNSIKSLNIVAITDVHLGTVINNRRLSKLIGQINKLNPDIVLFGGDLVDEDIGPVIRHGLGNELLKIKSKYGVYAVTGNHEYIGGAEKAITYLEKYQVHFLRDTFVNINDEFYIVGREDKDMGRFSSKQRKTIEELMIGINQRLPIILLDHQPFNLPLAAKNKIDLQISGHTHHGQMFPFNLITNAIYEVSQGYKQIAESHFYVSSGFGSWGPPIRIGTRSEIVNIQLHFD